MWCAIRTTPAPTVGGGGRAAGTGPRIRYPTSLTSRAVRGTILVWACCWTARTWLVVWRGFRERVWCVWGGAPSRRVLLSRVRVRVRVWQRLLELFPTLLRYTCILMHRQLLRARHYPAGRIRAPVCAAWCSVVQAKILLFRKKWSDVVSVSPPECDSRWHNRCSTARFNEWYIPGPVSADVSPALLLRCVWRRCHTTPTTRILVTLLRTLCPR